MSPPVTPMADVVALEALPPGRSTAPARMRRSAHLITGGVVVACAALVAVHPETLTPGQAALAAAIVLAGLAPGLVYLARGAKEPVPLLPLHGLFYAVAFGVVAFFPELDWKQAGEDAVTRALALTLCGVLALYAAYGAAGRLARGLRPVRIPVQATPAALRAWAWLFFAVHLAYLYVPRIAAIPSAPQLLYPLGWVAMGLLFSFHLRGRLPAWQAALFYGVALPAELLIRLVSGLLAEVFMALGFLLLIFWQTRRRVPWLQVAVVLALFFALNPMKFRYRVMVRTLPADATPIDKAETFLSAVAGYYSARGDDAAEAATGSSINRLGMHLPLFAYTLERTPQPIPYWGGETYEYFLYTLVPRAFWPDKPSAAFGNEFGHRYRILAPGMFDTSINIPWVVEFFVNFGPWAVPAGMALVGLLMRLLVQKLNNPAANDCESVFALTLCFQLIWAESNLAITWGGLLQTALALYLVLTVASRRIRW